MALTDRQLRRIALKAWLRTAVSMAVLIFIYFVVPLRRSDLAGTGYAVRGLLLLGGLVLLIWLVTVQVKRALRAHRIVERLAALLMVVTFVMVFFAGLFYVLAYQFSGIQTRLDALYFSVVTLSTVGYGDIVPVAQTARLVVMVQIIFDLIFITTAISIIATTPHRDSGAPHQD